MSSRRLSAFVARRKLAELLVTRERLRAAYAEIEARAADLPPREAVAVLAEGLAGLRQGADKVHPEVVNLEVTTADPRADHVRWRERLLRSIRQGRARADAIAMYGGALGEWLAPDRARHRPTEAELGALRARPEAPTPSLWARLDRRLDVTRVAAAREEVRRACAALTDVHHAEPVGADAQFLDGPARADARSLRLDDASDPGTGEFRAALRLAWRDVLDWDWTTVSEEADWTGRRFRLRPRTDYVSACLVASIGRAVARVVEPWSGRARLNRRLRVARLEALGAPAVIVDNERKSLALCPAPWSPDEDLGAEGSVTRERLLRRAGEGGGYAYGGGAQAEQMAMLASEIALARARGRTLHVVKTDLADFFPSVSHALVDELLAGMGVTDAVRALILRVVSPPGPDGHRPRRGLPLCLELSQVLAEIVVDILVSEVRAVAPVDVWVVTDDLLLTSEDPAALDRAYAALVEVVAAAGLALRADKTGRFPDGPAPVRWGLLALGPEGWTLAPDVFAAFLAETRTHIEGHAAVLDRAAAWRGQLAYLWGALAPAMTLGPQHLATVRAALEAFASMRVCSADGVEHEGVTAMVRHELAHRFLDGAAAEVPDAWLHWPVSAGGIGLRYPPADLVPLELAAVHAPAPPLPDAPFTPDDPAWGAWYVARLVPLAPRAPADDPSMDALVSRFLKRGARLGQPALALTPYWRWVLTAFGPDILDAFGSFDFVSTELVPATLIRESLGTRAPAARPAGEDVPF